jgi:hypothetical protein
LLLPAETTLVNDKFVAFDEQNTRADGAYQILCPECDKGINSTAWKCPHCGHQLRNPEENIELPSLESYVPLVLQDKAAVFQELLREAFRTSRHPDWSWWRFGELYHNEKPDNQWYYGAISKDCAIAYWKYLSQTLDSQTRASYFCKVFGIPFPEARDFGLAEFGGG